ncbi:hypothetical protein [Acaryochloris marina]|uniref:Uncharacterized protein n=1 Tax=Acaryochloris marina (strain MBIC 11017) TaxID=329726 RepID=A8ZK55_ACAM1|nr:hypothetical protein [Acaryochloris marina]ABW31555.1 hypothetical protein AM1_A0046 [Acaryochloris marina MBIC11017]
MTPPIVALNPKPVPKTIPQLPKSVPSAPKLVSRTAFPKKTPEGTRPAKLEQGHEELGGLRRSFRRPSQSTKPEFTPKTRSSEAPQVNQPRTPRVSAELERRFRNLELKQKNLVEQTRTRGELEYLAVSKNSSGRYWITVAGTGKPFVRNTFASAEFSWGIDVEIEGKFENGYMIELCPLKTMN